MPVHSQLSLDSFWTAQRSLQAAAYNAAAPLHAALSPRHLAHLPRSIVVVLGAPGSGKTSSCVAAAATLGYTHVCVGALLKQEIELGTEDAAEIAACMHAGRLVPTATVLRVLRHLEKSAGPVLLDGFPRVQEQIGLMEQFGSVAGAIFLDCKEELLIERMDKTNCDDPIALLQQFTDHCLPVVVMYDKVGKLHCIHTEKPWDEVQAELVSTIKAL